MRRRNIVIVICLLVMVVILNSENKKEDKDNINLSKIERADFIRAKYENNLLDLAQKSNRLKILLQYYARHREVGVLNKISDNGKYGGTFWLDSQQQPAISLIIVLKEDEPLLRANLPTIYGPVNHGAAYDFINNNLLLYESGLEQDDKFYAVISFAHELYHAYTVTSDMVKFDTEADIAQAEIATHIFVSAVLDDLTNGWYLNRIRETVKSLFMTDPLYFQNNQGIPQQIVNQINLDISKKIGSPGTFQISFDIIIGLSLVSFQDKESRIIFLNQVYLQNLHQGVQ